MVKPFMCASLAAGLLVLGCDSKVQQVKPPRIADEVPAETDMAGEPEDKGSEVTAPSKKEQKRLCCEQCQKALENDKSGDAPDKIPCQDFTADLDETCLRWFRENPMKADQAKACAAAGAPKTGDAKKSGP
jgi:hypothetical protein